MTSHSNLWRNAVSAVSLVMAMLSAGYSYGTSREYDSSARSANAAQEAKSVDNVKTTAIKNFGRLPLSFEPNRGQLDRQVEYVSRGRWYTLFLARREAVLLLSTGKDMSAVVRMKAIDANPHSKVVGEAAQEGKSNYFIGNDRSKWRTGLPHYARVRYQEVYPGIDQVFYGKQGELEYDFIVAAGADPDQIRLRFDGVDGLVLDRSGDLLMELAGGGVLRQGRPVVYQEIDGERRKVEAQFKVKGKREVTIELGAYDRNQELVIDPVLDYSTLIGGGGGDWGVGLAVDDKGDSYLTGLTTSTDFPTTTGAFQTIYGGGAEDIFVAKLNATGTDLIYSTFIGGNTYDRGVGIAVDGKGDAYLTGWTESPNYPTTSGAYRTALNGAMADVFVTKLNAAGSTLIYSTLVGGTHFDAANDIGLDNTGNVYLTGVTNSSDYPISTGAAQSSHGGDSDIFVTKLNSSGTDLIYSTYLGGRGYEQGRGISVDNSGGAYLTGDTNSANFPTTAGAFQPAFGGGLLDAFVTKLNATGTKFDYSTYLGGASDERGHGIAVDTSGNAYLAGETTSPNFPTTTGAYQTALTSITDAFVTKMDAAGTKLIYSTFLGGKSYERLQAIVIDDTGNAYVAGTTSSTDYPVTTGAYQAILKGSYDVIVTKLNPTGSALVYSTFIGGSGIEVNSRIRLDKRGGVYLTGLTYSKDYPLSVGAYQTTLKGAYDAFVTKLDLSAIMACPILSLEPITLPDATYGTTYPDQMMTTTGGAGVMTFAHSKGVMPPWMTLSSTGFLSGAAVNILGKYTFTIMAKDATGCEVNREYTVSSTLSRTASLCLVDDIDASKTAIVNFATGEYSINGGAVRLSKKGALSITDSQLALVDRSGGNEINIKVNRFDGRGQASARIAGTPVKSVYINDGSILNNPCVIRP